MLLFIQAIAEIRKEELSLSVESASQGAPKGK